MAARNLSQPAPHRWMAWFGVFNAELKDNLLSARVKAQIDNDGSRAFRQLLEKESAAR